MLDRCLAPDINDESHGRAQCGDVSKILFRPNTEIDTAGAAKGGDTREKVPNLILVGREVVHDTKISARFRKGGRQIPELGIAQSAGESRLLNWRSLNESYPGWTADNYSESKQQKGGFDLHERNDDLQRGLPSTDIADWQIRLLLSHIPRRCSIKMKNQT